MNTLAAYLIVIAVWATTPLGIKWSGEALPAFAAAGGRMALAALLGVLWLMVRGQGLPLHRRALSSYGAALPGIFGAMGCSYMAARDLPSGLLSVVFGMAPLISGVMLLAVRGGARFNGWHWMACLLGLVGLGLVFGDSLAALFGGGAALEGRGRGMLWILAAVSLFALSGIVVQRVGAGLAPMQQTVGGLIGSLPLYGLAMLITGQGLQWSGDLRGLGAIVYLAVFGSLVGFYCYFLVLSRLPAATVALVTLITPVLALSLGAWLNDEQLGPRVLAGAAVIVAALGLYLFGDRRVRRQVVSATVGDG
ncbi:DMT family transporter [Alloalcanivorax gelatiniphagus]|uniref:EamA/RhaT family transporter n=1 Tax=Alloalcanivorax gelatiniphagus TaxID=1194167 RepID=A0ABY2XQR4_9GAMM|nr:EamA family transporter [Alloalcanivorax gelatiniphagus]TMW15235.1 EamA/RhaT family transporter [Alloalcanivorax gelatiniphagus]